MPPGLEIISAVYSLEVKALERMENARRNGGGGLFGYAQTTAFTDSRQHGQRQERTNKQPNIYRSLQIPEPLPLYTDRPETGGACGL